MIKHTDIYTTKEDGGIDEYFDYPCQVKFVDCGHIDYIEDHLDDIIEKADKNKIPYCEDGKVDTIKLALMLNQYNSGIAYCGEIICGCCGGIVSLDEVYYLRVYENWINLDREIIGDDDVEED